MFDPFSGTATTALSAAYHGHDAVTIDINPFLVWLGQVKTAQYSPEIVAKATMACQNILAFIRSPGVEEGAPPPIHNVSRWWSPEALSFLCRLRTAMACKLSPGTPEWHLLRVAFCRSLIACSNAAFNHQSMSFMDNNVMCLDLQVDYPEMFRQNVQFVLSGAADNPRGSAQVMLHDARQLGALGEEPFDLVVTSPPYANRMSYIRELRPYMYWLSFLVSGQEAGELDWQAIGGTWGVATSRLNDWEPPQGAYSSNELEETLARIAGPRNANGALLAAYIRKYFVDIAAHAAQLRAILKPGGNLHYIVGNSTFYGELLSVERVYADILSRSGFTNVGIRPIRKRNSKKELVEFDVSATHG